MRERQRRARLQRLDRDVAANLADDGQVEQLSDKKALVVLKLGYDDLQQIVGLARDQVTGDHFGHLDDSALESLRMFVGMAVNLHAEEDRKSETDATASQARSVAVDVTIALETLDPSQARRWRQPDLFRQFDVGQSRIGLEFGHDTAVDRIKVALRHKTLSTRLSGAWHCAGQRQISSVCKDAPQLSVGWFIQPHTKRVPIMTENSSLQALLEAVDRYFTLMYDNDVSRFERVFAPTAQLHGFRGDELRILSGRDYNDMLASAPSPKSSNAPRLQQILLVDFASTEQAMVKVRVRINTIQYLDYLAYHRIKGNWLITAKSFHVERRYDETGT